jgi:VanZ family protein
MLKSKDMADYCGWWSFELMIAYRGSRQMAANVKSAPVLAFAAWVAFSFIVYCTLSPLQQRPGFPAPASFEHIAAFAVVGVLFGLAYPRHLILISMLVLGSVLALEMAQLMTPDRHARVHDAIEKITGGIVGIAAGRAILYLRQAATEGGS